MKYEYVLGIDGGGTKTHVVMMSLDGVVVAEAYLAKPANPISWGPKFAIDTIVNAIEQAKTVACIGREPHIVGLVVALPGVADERMRQLLTNLLHNETGLKKTKLLVVPDTVPALCSVASEGPALVMIAGTGAVAWGRGLNGQEERSDGYGVGGDRGSGTWIGLKGIEYSLLAADGLLPSTTLLSRLMDYFDTKSLRDFVVKVNLLATNRRTYQQTANKITPIVTKEAQQGETTAMKVCNEASTLLAETTIATAKKLHLENQPFPIGLVGGVWGAGPVILDPYIAFVQRSLPNAKVISTLPSPAFAAARMAIGLL